MMKRGIGREEGGNEEEDYSRRAQVVLNSNSKDPVGEEEGEFSAMIIMMMVTVI